MNYKINTVRKQKILFVLLFILTISSVLLFSGCSSDPTDQYNPTTDGFNRKAMLENITDNKRRKVEIKIKYDWLD